MHRRTLGGILLCISAFLYGVRYLAAAIFGSNVNSWDQDLFNSMLDYVGTWPLILSIVSLIAGVVYLFIAEFETRIVKALNEIKDNWNESDTQNDKMNSD